MSINLKKILSVTATAAVMTLIFMFSAQTSEESSQVSTGLTQKIVDVVAAVTAMSPDEKAGLVLNIHNIIRKAAHFTIYGLLGVCSGAMFRSFMSNVKFGRIILYAAAFCCVYACTDEFHQLFVSGRGPQITDVLIDTCGALCGAALLAGLSYVVGRRKNYD
ncbi:MAG: VanZ family protein [Clostridia bacterium]|nr:VanZ family protein [Clostridia bacterium]